VNGDGGDENEGDEDAVYHCESCGHDNTDPKRNTDGNLECDECGEVLPESVRTHQRFFLFLNNVV
jgi:uncharacterized Zn finger protein